MAFLEERVREIEQQYAHLVQDVLVLRLTEETLRLVLVLNDGTTLRVAERWLENFSHHKHISERAKRVPSHEVCLEDVMAVLENTTPTARWT